MPASESLFCFTSNKVDFPFLRKLSAQMMLDCINSDRLNLELRTFGCFNCDGSDNNSSHRLGSPFKTSKRAPELPP
jgi:hypothetical protein